MNDIAQLFDVTEVARRLGIGRTRTFELIGRGEIASVRIGRRRLVAATALQAYIERLEECSSGVATRSSED